MIKTVFHFSLLAVVGMLSVAGCGSDEAETVDFIVANPPNDSTLQPDATIIVIFDGVPNDVAVNSGTPKIDNRMVTISGPFPPGPLNLEIAWSDTSCAPRNKLCVLNYTVAESQENSLTDMGPTPTGKSQMESVDSETDKDE